MYRNNSSLKDDGYVYGNVELPDDAASDVPEEQPADTMGAPTSSPAFPWMQPKPAAVAQSSVKPAERLAQTIGHFKQLKNPFVASAQPTPALGRKQKGTDIESLISLGSEYEYYIDSVGDKYAEIPGIPFAVRVGSSEFEGHFLKRHKEEFGNIPDISMSRISKYFENLATINGLKNEVFNRFAHRIEADGSTTLAIDMADSNGTAIVVRSDGWRLTTQHGFKFKRLPHMAALPTPSENGNLLPLFDILNLHRPQDKLLIVPWLVVAPNVVMPRPILTMLGVQGSAKTTTALMLRNMLDPVAAGGVYVPNKNNELAQALFHNAVPIFDNLSSLAPSASDLLCLACTGGGISKRKLFTDAGDVTMHFKRSVILTAINSPLVAQDLVDRSLIIELEHITPRARLYEADLWREFNANRPFFLGGLLNLLAAAMGRVESIQLQLKPRLADYCRMAAAVADVLGTDAGFGKDQFVEAFFKASSDAYGDGFGDDPLANLMLRAVEELGPMSLSVTELHDGLRNYAMHLGIDFSWYPKSPSALSRKLKSLVKFIEGKGWSITFSENARENRVVSIVKM